MNQRGGDQVLAWRARGVSCPLCWLRHRTRRAQPLTGLRQESSEYIYETKKKTRRANEKAPANVAVRAAAISFSFSLSLTAIITRIVNLRRYFNTLDIFKDFSFISKINIKKPSKLRSDVLTPLILPSYT